MKALASIIFLAVFSGLLSQAQAQRCHDSRDCFSNEHCVAGQCVPKSDRCISNVDCAFPEHCIEGRCMLDTSRKSLDQVFAIAPKECVTCQYRAQTDRAEMNAITFGIKGAKNDSVAKVDASALKYCQDVLASWTWISQKECIPDAKSSGASHCSKVACASAPASTAPPVAPSECPCMQLGEVCVHGRCEFIWDPPSKRPAEAL